MKITVSIQIKPREIKELKEVIASEIQEKFDAEQITKGIETLVKTMEQSLETSVEESIQ